MGKRALVLLSDRQRELIDQYLKRYGLKFGELIRAIVNEWIRTQIDKGLINE